MRVGLLTSATAVPAWLEETKRRLSCVSGLSVRMVAARREEGVYYKPLMRWFRWMQQHIVPGRPEWWRNLPVTSSRPEPVDLLVNALGLDSSYGAPSWPVLGVLTIRFGKGEDHSDEAGFSEWLRGDASMGISIVRQWQDGGGKQELVVDAITRLEPLSFTRTQALIYSRAVDLIEDAVHKIQSGDSGSVRLISGESCKPGNVSLLYAFCVFAWRALMRGISSALYDDRWVILVARIPSHGLFVPTPATGELVPSKELRFSAIEPPDGYFWADPFLVAHNDEQFLFFEEADVRTGKGHLACLRLGAGPGSRTRILQDDKHLSYPFVFQHGDVWYLIPESAQRESVDLYEATDFPYRWKKLKSLLSGISAFDATVHEADGRLWLFCTVCRSAGGPPNDDLFIFHTDDLLTGEWKSHPGNPVVRGADRARPAGRIFVHDGSLIRPSQIGIPRYGYGIQCNRILELSETSYREEPAGTILPDFTAGNYLAVHTWNDSNGMVVTDAIRRRFRFCIKF